MDARVVRLTGLFVVALMCLTALAPAMNVVAAKARNQVTPDGLVWADDKRVTNNPSPDLHPQVSVDKDGNSHLIWTRDTDYMYIKLDYLGRSLVQEHDIAQALAPVQHSGQLVKAVGIDSTENISMIHAQYGSIIYEKDTTKGVPVVQPIDVASGLQLSSGANLVVAGNGKVYIIYDYFPAGGLERVGLTMIDPKGNIIKTAVDVSEPAWYVEGSTMTVDRENKLRALENVWFGGNVGIWATTLDKYGVRPADTPPQFIYPTSAYGFPPMPAMTACPDNTVHLLRSSSGSGGGTLTYVKLDYKNRPVAGIDTDIVVTQTAADYGDIACDSTNNIYMIWADSTDGLIYYEKMAPGTENDTHNAIQLTTKGTAREPRIALGPGGNVHVVWKDDRDGNDEVYYKFAFSSGAELDMPPEEIAKMMFIHPEEIKSANVTLKNLGGLNDTFLLNLTIDYQGHPNTGWKAWLETDTIDLDELALSKFQVYVKGSKDCYYTENINVTIKATSQRDPLKNASITFRVFNMCCETISVSFPDDVHMTGAGEPTVYIGSVKNGGDLEEDIVLTLEGPGDWDYKLDVNETVLKPRETMQIGLTVTPPADALGDETGTVMVEGRSVERPQIKGSAMTHTIVNPMMAIGLALPDPMHYIDPGNTTEFEITVSNDGNLAGIVVVVVEIVSGAGDWNAYLDRGSLGLAANAKDTIKLTVQSPVNARAGTRTVIRLEAFNDAMTQRNAVTATVIINQVHRLDIAAVPDITTVDPGGTAGYHVSVTNLGNGDELLNPETARLPPTWSLDYKSGGSALTGVLLAPGATAGLSMEVHVPLDAMTGDYEIVGRLTDEQGINWTVPVLTVVSQIYSIEMTAAQSIAHGTPGDTVIFDCKVRNLGNGPDNMVLDTAGLPAGWKAQYVINGSVVVTLRLEALTSARALLMVDIPLDALTSSILFSATSTSTVGIISDVALVVNVGLPNLRMTNVTYMPATFKKDKATSIKVLMVNDGGSDCTDVVVRFYEGDHQMDSQTIKVFPAGTEKAVLFTWVPAGTGEYKLRYVIDPENRIVETDKKDNVMNDKVTVGSSGGGGIPGFEPAFVIMAIAIVAAVLVVRRRE